MKDRLPKIERETHIVFNDAEPTATVTTTSKKWQRGIEQWGIKPSDEDGYGDKEYLVPKGWIKSPRPPRNVSAGTRAKRSELMTEINRKRKADRKGLAPVHQ